MLGTIVNCALAFLAGWAYSEWQRDLKRRRRHERRLATDINYRILWEASQSIAVPRLSDDERKRLEGE